MRALTAQERADREHDARVQKWSKSVKAAQKAVFDYQFTEVKVLSKNDAERKRIEGECAQRVTKWKEGLAELEQVLDRAFKSRPSREVL